MGGTHIGADSEELQPTGRSHIGAVCECCLLWNGLHTGVGKECNESSLQGEVSCKDST